MADQQLIDAFRAVIEERMEQFLDNLGEEMTQDAIDDIKERNSEVILGMLERFRDALTITLDDAPELDAVGECIHYRDRSEPCKPCDTARAAVADLDDEADDEEEDEDDEG